MLFYKDSPMKRLLTALIALVAVTSLLAGCGQKGPLYLPDDSPSASTQDE
jgi:predicted small lipoprotein YifL